ncbi:MAG: hypothetical protein ACOCQD_00145 [archaeon]
MGFKSASKGMSKRKNKKSDNIDKKSTESKTNKKSKVSDKENNDDLEEKVINQAKSKGKKGKSMKDLGFGSSKSSDLDTKEKNKQKSIKSKNEKSDLINKFKKNAKQKKQDGSLERKSYGKTGIVQKNQKKREKYEQKLSKLEPEERVNKFLEDKISEYRWFGQPEHCGWVALLVQDFAERQGLKYDIEEIREMMYRTVQKIMKNKSSKTKFTKDLKFLRQSK